jgi:hypothetical protein
MSAALKSLDKVNVPSGWIASKRAFSFRFVIQPIRLAALSSVTAHRLYRLRFSGTSLSFLYLGSFIRSTNSLATK